MAFKQIDDDAYLADESLSAGILKQIADNGIAAHGDTTRGCGIAWDYRYPPLLHSIPSGNDSDIDPDADLGWIRFLWKPSRRVETIGVEVRATRYVGAVELGLHILPLDALISGREIGAPLDTANASSGEATTGLFAFDLSVTPGRTYAIIIAARSTLGSSVDGWYDRDSSDSGTPVSALSAWRRAAFIGLDVDDVSKNTHWRPSGGAYTPFATRIQPYALEWVNGSDPFVATYATGKSGPVKPAGRLLRREQNVDDALVADRDACYVWPPIAEDLDLTLTLDPGQDWIRRTEISYLELHGVHIYEEVRSVGSIGASIASDQAASARAVTAVDSAARRAVSAHPMVWSIAPSTSYVDGEADTSAGGFKQHAGTSIDLTTTYLPISDSFVGDPNRFSIGGDDYAQCKYRVTLELHLLVFSAEAGQSGPLTLKFEITDKDGASNPATVVTVTVESAPVTPVSNDNPKADAGYWLAGYPPIINDRTPHRHSTQGLWCQTAYRSARPIVIEVIVPDDSGVGGEVRSLRIEAKRGDDVEYPAARAHLYLDALSVTAFEGLDENAGEVI